jgi:hypothetical protein
MARSVFESDFALGDRVYIDGDQSIKATVTGFKFGSVSHWAVLSWMHDGKTNDGDFELFRLSKVE